MKLNILITYKSGFNSTFNTVNWIYQSINLTDFRKLSDEEEFFNTIMLFKKIKNLP